MVASSFRDDPAGLSIRMVHLTELLSLHVITVFIFIYDYCIYFGCFSLIIGIVIFLIVSFSRVLNRVMNFNSNKTHIIVTCSRGGIPVGCRAAILPTFERSIQVLQRASETEREHL